MHIEFSQPNVKSLFNNLPEWSLDLIEARAVWLAQWAVRVWSLDPSAEGLEGDFSSWHQS